MYGPPARLSCAAWPPDPPPPPPPPCRYPHNLLAVTRLPDGAQLSFGLCQLDSGTCETVSVDSGMYFLAWGLHWPFAVAVRARYANSGRDVTFLIF